MGRKIKRRPSKKKKVFPIPTPAPPTQDQIRQWVEAGAAHLNSRDGMVEVAVNPELAWEIDPWFWTTGTDYPTHKYRELGCEPPVAVYVNRDYQVSIFDEPSPVSSWPDMWHLSFKRRDREPFHDWRIAQRIKNTIVGPENEGVELYPADSRLVDTANQYHLFVIKDPEVGFPFGFRERLVTSDESHGSKQRRHSEGVLESDSAAFHEKLKHFAHD